MERELRQAIADQMTPLLDALASGNIATIDHFRQITGEIRGYKRVLSLMDEIEKARLTGDGDE